MIQKLLSRNIELKLASLILAIALWFFVILSGRSEITLNIPITFQNLPSELEIIDSPQTVSISIEGQKRIIKNLKQNEVSSYIDLEGAKAGRSFFTLSKDNIEMPKTLIITNIDPETVSLKLEIQMKKTVSVKPYVVGLPEKGYVIMDITVEPEEIDIEGPKSIIAKIRSVKTEPIDISGINNNLKYKANLDLKNSTIRKNINKVDVNIAVKNIEQ